MHNMNNLHLHLSVGRKISGLSNDMPGKISYPERKRPNLCAPGHCPEFVGVKGWITSLGVDIISAATITRNDDADDDEDDESQLVVVESRLLLFFLFTRGMKDNPLRFDVGNKWNGMFLRAV